VARIIHRDLGLKCVKRRRAQLLSEANRLARLTRCKQLLKQYSEHAVDMIWFSDEKIFTVQLPSNAQNDRLYTPVRTKKRNIAPSRLLSTRSTFGKSVMVSVAVSKMGMTDLIFVEPGAKVNGHYYRETLLLRQMLPAIKRVAGDTFVFQQTVCQRIGRVKRSNCWSAKPQTLSLRICGPPTALTSIRSITSSGGSCNSGSIRLRSRMLMNSRSDLLKFGLVLTRTLLTLPSMNGENVCVLVFERRADISNIYFRQLNNWTIG